MLMEDVESLAALAGVAEVADLGKEVAAMVMAVVLV